MWVYLAESIELFKARFAIYSYVTILPRYPHHLFSVIFSGFSPKAGFEDDDILNAWLYIFICWIVITILLYIYFRFEENKRK